MEQKAQEAPYKKLELPLIIANLIGNYCPPLGCDCWEPKSKGDTNV